MTTYKLSDVVSKAFSEPHQALKSSKYNQLVLKGGRASGKSSYASVEGILLLLNHKEINGVVMRKVGNTLRSTVYSQYIWAIGALGLHGKFKCTVSPMEIIYRPTRQKIMFFGADDPGKIKSLKVSNGYIGFLHLEELDQFSGEEEVRNIEQSVLRGGELSFEIKTFNPPRTKDNWANKYCLTEKDMQLIHHSTFETMPREWLGNRILNDAEHLKQINPAAYEHEFLGIANSTGGSVFENVVVENISEDIIKSLDRFYYGVDWGFYPDPWAFVKCAYNHSQRILYIIDEKMELKKSNRQTADFLLNEKKLTRDDLIICDSSEPKSVADYLNFGLYARGAEKGPDSVKYSTKFLQGLTKIVIDKTKCPHTAKEFLEYEYEKTRDGEIISGYPDKNNHFIDGVRYSLNLVWRQGGS